MNLITSVDIPKYGFKISHKSKTLFTGSCFAENIGAKLEELKFPVQINPLGINYNPVSIGKSLAFTMLNKQFSENNLFLANDLWNSYDFHSQFSNTDKGECLNHINSSIALAKDFLKNTDYLFISFGTAYVYSLKSDGSFVSNCHKQDDKIFNRELLKPNEIVEYWSEIIKNLKEFNPDLKIFFTVSPVRHKRDGFIANQLSKSVLFVAINQLKGLFGDIFYFPSYEIMMDELRDYRFYDDDMIHPSSKAIKYIFEKFGESFFDKETQILNSRINKIIKGLDHKVFSIKSVSYLEYLERLREDIEILQKEYWFIDFNIELKSISETISENNL
ncbi:MAG: GSCFA domain-containing protein [Bacteroidales bacterium]|nr:GSCFA domain-containing protein [Bacteroidales bacterium]